MMIKLKDINALGLLPETKSESKIDHTRLVVWDEFNKHEPEIDGGYRRRAIKRLIKLGTRGFGFRSEQNILPEMTERYLKLTCPYCRQTMSPGLWSGASLLYDFNYHCDCGAKGSIQIHAEAMRFEPPAEAQPTSARNGDAEDSQP